MEVLLANKNRDTILNPRTGFYFHPGVTLAVGESFPEVGACGGFWSVKKTADNGFVPSDVRLNGMFTPSFLSDKDKASFRELMATHYP